MSTLEKIKKMDQDIKTLKEGFANFDKILSNIYQFSNMSMRKILNTEQSLTYVAKTLKAVVEELSEKDKSFSESVMKRIRLEEDEEEKNKVKTLLESEVITPSEEVKNDSLVVVKEALKNNDGTEKVVSEYHVVQMASTAIPDEIKNSLLGKTVGSIISRKEGETEYIATVIEIYDHVQKIEKTEANN